MKGAEKLGLHITPSQAKAFGEYMDMRFSQQSDSFRYRFANYVEDFQAIQEKKGYNTRDIVKDFNLYLNDRYGLIQHSEQMKGYTADQADRIFADWMSVNGFDSYDEDNE